MTRTTLNLNDDLLVEAKALAARERLSLTRLIEQALALRMRQPGLQAACPKPIPLPVYRGKGGLRAEISDPASNRQLFDAADGLLP